MAASVSSSAYRMPVRSSAPPLASQVIDRERRWGKEGVGTGEGGGRGEKSGRKGGREREKERKSKGVERACTRIVGSRVHARHSVRDRSSSWRELTEDREEAGILQRFFDVVYQPQHLLAQGYRELDSLHTHAHTQTQTQTQTHTHTHTHTRLARHMGGTLKKLR